MCQLLKAISILIAADSQLAPITTGVVQNVTGCTYRKIQRQTLCTPWLAVGFSDMSIGVNMTKMFNTLDQAI